MYKRFLIRWAALMLCLPMNAQNKEFPNAIHAKINIIDYGALFNGTARISQGFELGYFRNVAPFLNVGLPFKMAVAKLPNETDNRVTNSFDLNFHIENIRDQSKISPYLFGGAGLFIENFKKTDIHFPFGVGLNFRISKYAFVNLQGEFRKAMADNRDNVQLGAGFVYLLHKSEILPTEIKPIDTDKDGVPDLVDRCPNEFGPASALGCPDADGDGLGDAEDLCPQVAGSLETFGCPDTDGDGVPDKDDACPEVAGTLEGCPDADSDGFADHLDECPNEAGRWKGCPDRDFDGVPDKDDDCPDEPGKSENKGCPEKKDADGDGFADTQDECPDVPGTVKGCPDSDNDGFADKNDACPDVPGTVQGCPDGDGDGVADKDDACPTVAGKYAGCPDTDGDGVPDNLDKCPTTPGVAEAQGCPPIKEETKERLAFAMRAVQFETGKSTLKMESFAILDEVFNIMKQYPDYKLTISGHTDNVGDSNANLQLSSLRAKACQDYLLFRGINMERLRSSGYGASRPVASNATATGREMNRRVEFELVVD